MRRDVLPGQVGGALKFLFRQFELRAGFFHGGFRRFQLGLGHVQGGFDVRIVQPRQNLSFLHFHALLDEHLDDFAGDFGRHRRRPARRDVTGGIQHRVVPAGAANFVRDCRPHLDGFGPRQPPNHPCRQNQNENANGDRPDS